MIEIGLKDLADYHTEIWHERNGWVATERSVTPSVQLFKIGYVLGMEKLQKENARLREALEGLRNDYSFGNGQVYDDIAKALERSEG